MARAKNIRRLPLTEPGAPCFDANSLIQTGVSKAGSMAMGISNRNQSPIITILIATVMPIRPRVDLKLKKIDFS